MSDRVPLRLEVTVNGTPYELLYRIHSPMKEAQLWWVQPLAPGAEQRQIMIRDTDDCTFSQ